MSTDRNYLTPPEAVPLRLEVAGLGARLGAQMTDILLTLLAAVCVVILLSLLGATSPRALQAIVILLFFLIRVPYYVLAELAWNGQTLGKRLMGIRVVSHDGGSLQVHAIVLRNMVKEAEVFLPATLVLMLDADSPVFSLLALLWVAGTLIVPLRDRYNRRLGDLMAGTHVVFLPKPVLLPDLSARAPSHDRFPFLPHQLDHYGAYELQTLEKLLRAQAHGSPDHQAATRDDIVQRIRRKIVC